jgi:heterodisulfide reductase subunit A
LPWPFPRWPCSPPSQKETLSIDKGLLVIGGGIAGMTGALALADQGFQVSLVEQSDRLGGNANSIYQTAAGDDVQELPWPKWSPG